MNGAPVNEDCLKLTSYFGERIARVLPELGGLLRRPLLTLEQVRICKRDGNTALRAAGISGATIQRGVWGFHGGHAPHGDRLFQLGRRVPAVTIVIDAPERIATAFAIIDELTAEQGLVTSEAVPAIRPAGTGHDPASVAG